MVPSLFFQTAKGFRLEYGKLKRFMIADICADSRKLF